MMSKMAFTTSVLSILFLLVFADDAVAADKSPEKVTSFSLRWSCHNEGAESVPCLLDRVTPEMADSETWQSLLNQVAPKIQIMADQSVTAEKLVAHQAPQGASCQNDTQQIRNIDVSVTSQFILALVHTSSCEVLAVFSQSVPRKLQFSFVTSDIGGSLRGGEESDVRGIFPIGVSDHAIWIASSHANSEEFFEQHRLFVFRNGKLELSYDGPSLYSVQNISFSASMKMLPTIHDGYHDLGIAVLEKNNQSIKNRYSWSIFWDPTHQKYMGGSKTLMSRITQLSREHNE